MSMVKTRKRVFISDLHMGYQETQPAPGEFPYVRLKGDGTKAAADFFRWVRESGEFFELVLLGDILDRWCYPVDVFPPSYDQIADAPENREITRELRNLAQTSGITVTYLPGNHDQDMDRATVNRLFPGMVFLGDAPGHGVFKRGRLRAEHGNVYSLFNAPDPVNEPKSRLPLGYFVERIWATHARKTGIEHHSGLGWFRYIDDLFRCSGPKTISSCAFEMFLREAGLDLDTIIVGVPGEFDSSGKVTARRIRDLYQHLFEQRDSAGPDETGRTALGALFADKSLGRVADDLCHPGETNLVIFGHSHEAELDRDWLFVEDRIYANCGAWCDAARPRTFIVTEEDAPQDRHIVRQRSWEHGTSKLLKEAWVWLSTQGE